MEETFGQKLVGVSFNPSKMLNIDIVKGLCAELLDVLNDSNDPKNQNEMSKVLFEHAIGEVLNAQMSVVKFLVSHNTQTTNY